MLFCGADALCFPARISPVQLSDAGVYTCVARSRAGLAELSYDVQVQGNGRTHSSLQSSPVSLMYVQCVLTGEGI